MASRATSIEIVLVRTQSEILHAFRSSRQTAAKPPAGEEAPGAWPKPVPNAARILSAAQAVSRNFNGRAANPTWRIQPGTSGRVVRKF